MQQTVIDEAGWTTRGESGPRVVALGGGHGLSATLRALRHITRRLTAVVTVADDGGSSGRLRAELSCLPPGDLRMALAALCDDSEWGLTWRDALQHRFKTGGPLDQHALGNLLIVTLWDLLGDEVEGLDWVARLLGSRGRVLPMAAVPVVIEAEVESSDGPKVITGQVNVATNRDRVNRVSLIPPNPPVREEVLEAVSKAEWIVMGPGSWYTSVLPHLLVPQLRSALADSPARRALILNLSPETGETERLTVPQLVEVFHDHAPEIKIDVVIADPSAVAEYDELEQAASLVGAKVLLRQVRTGNRRAIHDPLRLAAALRDAFEGFLSEVGHKEF